MYRGLKIGVVVPAYNEERFILQTLGTMPAGVDRIFVVEDGSTDSTRALILGAQAGDPRVHLVAHDRNLGLGQSLIDGYVASAASDVEATAVMAGYNQMDPADLPRLLDAMIDRKADYVKGNRLLHANVQTMPRYRFAGNAILTILTKFATGYYAVMDPQCGYTVIRNEALRTIPIGSMTKGYGYNADILCMLNIHGYSVTDVEVRPVYEGQPSKIVVSTYVIKTTSLLLRLFFRRLWQRYVVRDFHPLVLFYFSAIVNTLFIVLPLTGRFFYMYWKIGEAPQTTLIILSFTILITFQAVLFAIWMDMDYNRSRT